MHNKTQKIW